MKKYRITDEEGNIYDEFYHYGTALSTLPKFKKIYLKNLKIELIKDEKNK